jgi:putative endonuclease
MRNFYVYILCSLSRCIYIGVTNDLMRRVAEHKEGKVPGFTRRYRVTRLVYFENTADVRVAISREKQLKRWPRWRKDRLIEKHNAAWEDLSAQWTEKGIPARAIARIGI